MTTVQATLPTFEAQLNKVAAAERGDGWLSACDDTDRFLLPNQQFVASLAELLRSLDSRPILEVCAGRGELAEALRWAGIPIVATDAEPAAGSAVERAPTEEALRRHRPAVVLGCFVPVDAGVDQAVLRFPSVRHYLVLGARLGGLLGSAALWRNPNWSARRLEQVSRWMLTRHDVWLGMPRQPILQHGEAWHLRRGRKAS